MSTSRNDFLQAAVTGLNRQWHKKLFKWIQLALWNCRHEQVNNLGRFALLCLGLYFQAGVFYKICQGECKQTINHMCSYHRHNIRFQDIVCLKLKLNGQDIKKYQQKGHNFIKCETDKKTRN